MCRLGWAKARGYQVLADLEEAEERREHCYDCVMFTEAGTCRKCGCDVDSKTLLLPESCPMKKWPSIWRKSTRK